ncbi:MAG: hypothetical protein MIO90_06005 [Methanomassiliicoccales archaeon]|nr:hypothetical protein [Methanomassiliicoccales archaeon]
MKKQGFEIHRLTLTGYLRAMADLKVLKEKDVPPAKIYTPLKAKERDIYLKIAEQSRQTVGEKYAELALYALYKLFRRPIFKEELERAGILAASPGVEAEGDVMIEARKFMVKIGFKIPSSSKAYVPLNNDLEEICQSMLFQMIINDAESAYLVRETKQTKLEL